MKALVKVRKTNKGTCKTITKIAQDAIQQGTKTVALQNQKVALDSAALFLVKKRLNLYFGSSGCTRNYTSVCPTGWTSRLSPR